VSAAGSRAYAGDALCHHKTYVRHIYVHIPFCARICPYCAFTRICWIARRHRDFVRRSCAKLTLDESHRRIETALLASSINDLLRWRHAYGT